LERAGHRLADCDNAGDSVGLVKECAVPKQRQRHVVSGLNDEIAFRLHEIRLGIGGRHVEAELRGEVNWLRHEIGVNLDDVTSDKGNDVRGASVRLVKHAALNER
jgi:hypothetical protein